MGFGCWAVVLACIVPRNHLKWCQINIDKVRHEFVLGTVGTDKVAAGFGSGWLGVFGG